MRIITGKARGMKLRTLEGLATRPTSEAAKEGIFSAIQFELHDRRVLDLFGGSGQLALEALSRGAEFAVINDASREAANIIKENAQKTKLMPQCRILSADWKEYIRMAKGREQFDLILLDPPYTSGLLDEILAALLEAGLPSENAIIICESDEQGIPAPLEGYRQKLHRYGKSYVSVYRKEEEEA
ncbi:MAG: 16S rRNA (guanine(966)-N(2))-methyltransferase RsmD [Clostridia bacterium]|nr:16S rRNA (guanine(966)-N(2))-methyltransferase RsmD [Clostridia bacterium]